MHLQFHFIFPHLFFNSYISNSYTNKKQLSNPGRSTWACRKVIHMPFTSELSTLPSHSLHFCEMAHLQSGTAGKTPPPLHQSPQGTAQPSVEVSSRRSFQPLNRQTKTLKKETKSAPSHPQSGFAFGPELSSLPSAPSLPSISCVQNSN